MTTVRSKDGKLSFTIKEQKSEYTSRTWVDVIEKKGNRQPKLYTFRNLKQVEAYIASMLQRQDQKIAARATAKVERKEQAAKVKVGDIFVSSWGYEQTNVDFYRVEKLIGTQSMLVQKLTTATVEGSTQSHGMACNVVPGCGTVYEPFKARLNAYGGFKVNGSSYQTAHKWDGRPQYCSWYH
jgi:hypothetical protein